MTAFRSYPCVNRESRVYFACRLARVVCDFFPFIRNLFFSPIPPAECKLHISRHSHRPWTACENNRSYPCSRYRHVSYFLPPRLLEEKEPLDRRCSYSFNRKPPRHLQP